jgi:hypothetical protein
VPEFFCCPEVIGGEPKFTLPKWANSPLDVVYANRKAFECQHVSASLHHWIDCTFGLRQLSGSPQLFDEPHPERDDKGRDSMDLLTAHVGGGCFSAFTAGKSVVVFDSSGVLQEYEVVAGELRFVQQSELSDSKLLSAICKEASVWVVDRTQEHFVIVTSAFAGYYGVNKKAAKIKKVRAPRPLVYLAAAASYLVAVAEGGGTVFVYDEDTIILAIPQYNDSARCCAVSATFQTLVVGTEDKKLIVYELPSGVRSRDIDLGGETPVRVVIGDGLGFVVVATKTDRKHSIRVFTINGDFVRKIETEGPVARWAKWSPRSGIDHLALIIRKGSDNEMALFVCEMFTLNLRQVRQLAKNDVMTLRFVEDRELFLVAHRSGDLEFVRV